MSRWSGKTCRLTTMMVLTSSFFLVEIIVGTLTNSIALVADSFHMLSDVVALIVGFASVRISKWKTKRNTYGWQRAEVLGALVNSVFLLALCFSIIIESVKRLVEVEEVDSPAMLLIVGCLGLLVNVFGLFLFGGHGHSHGGGGHNHGHGHSHGGGGHGHSHHGHSHSHGHDTQHSHNHKRTNGTIRQDSGEGTNDVGVTDVASLDVTAEDEGGQKRLSSGQLSTTSTSTEREVIQVDNETHTEVIKHSGTSSSESLNMRGVFLHVLGDALGSVVVIISALAIWFVEGDWKYYLDPAMSILMVIIILSTTIPLFKESAYILLQTVPRHVDVEAITRELREIDGIAGVHEVHIWQLAGRRIIASAHVHCKDILEYMVLANKIKNVFHKAGIHSTTIQPEFPVHPGDDLVSCSLRCSTDAGDKCDQDTCCGPPSAIKGKRQDQYNNSNNSDSDHLLLRPSGEELEGGELTYRNRQHWDIPMEMSPEGDEVVLDLSKAEG